jgi:hypothetical protein
VKLKFRPTAEGRAHAAQQQKDALEHYAEAIERGDFASLTAADWQWVAAVLRHAASQIDSKPPKPGPGNPGKFDHGGAALRYFVLTGNRKEPLTPWKAVAQLAQEAQVTIEAVEKALRRQGVRLPTKPDD